MDPHGLLGRRGSRGCRVSFGRLAAMDTASWVKQAVRGESVAHRLKFCVNAHGYIITIVIILIYSYMIK